MTQSEAVRQAMDALGGYATFGQLYQTAPHIPGSAWGTKTPFASIRRIVQDGDAFVRIRPGVWGLAARQSEWAAQFDPAITPAPKVAEKTHAFYQGLLVQIGRWRGMETFVPAQDRNQPFQSGTLAQEVSLAKCPPFTYDPIVQVASYVDVVWLNGRGLPHTFFEVEHTTDIYNSLRKFGEFADFRARQFIVADPLRLNDYKAKLAANVFDRTRAFVQFYDYDTLVKDHALAAQQAQSGSPL